MSHRQQNDAGQLGFDALLGAADKQNKERRQERAHGHLPASMDEALPFYRSLIEKHHAAMLAGDSDTVQRIRSDAHHLALKLNNYEPGILADDDAPGCVLDRMTRAPDGTVPLWGQSGTFILVQRAIRVRIELEGMFGIGARFVSWQGFSAHAIDWDKPFLSETGYRSFLGVGGALEPGHSPESFCAAIIAAHVMRELKGKLRMITPRYRGTPAA